MPNRRVHLYGVERTAPASHTGHARTMRLDPDPPVQGSSAEPRGRSAAAQTGCTGMGAVWWRRSWRRSQDPSCLATADMVCLTG